MRFGLTTWIFIALVLGILFGWYLNVSFPAPQAQTPSETIKKIEQTTLKWASNNQDSLVSEVAVIVSNPKISDQEKLNNLFKIIGKYGKDTTLSDQIKQELRAPEPQNETLKKILEYLSILTDIFLRLIKMIIAPLVLTTLVAGVAKLGDLKAVGRIGGKTMLWFFSASFVSLFLGALLVNLYQPGSSLNVPLPNEALDAGVDHGALTLKGFITHIFPSSLFESLASNEIYKLLYLPCFSERHWPPWAKRENRLFMPWISLGTRC